jgi:molybdopterin-guanine dinucleotide biosynthesis protein A
MSAPVRGLVLAGGASTRMRRDKAALAYHGKPQLQWTFELLSATGIETFVSVRVDQKSDALRDGYPQIVDRVAAEGPIAGILSALVTHPESAWLVLACDLPFLDRVTLEHLRAQRDPARVATAYRSVHDRLPEPLCAIFEPRARAGIEAQVATGRMCPRRFLSESDALLLELLDARALDNVNTPEEWSAATHALSRPS